MSEVEIRPIMPGDTNVLSMVLRAMDPEDAELAGEALAEDDGSTFSLVEVLGRVVGVVGVNPIEGTQSAWLSWSGFLPEADRTIMAAGLRGLVDLSREVGLSRLIAMEADTAEGDGAMRHMDFLAALRSAGFANATRIPDFYEPGEGALYLVCAIGEGAPGDASPDPQPVSFTGAFEHEESDGAYVLDWEPSMDGAGREELANQIGWARDQGARLVVCSAPSTLTALASLLSEAGFRRLGALDGFYAPGVHEVQYVLSLN